MGPMIAPNSWTKPPSGISPSRSKGFEGRSGRSSCQGVWPRQYVSWACSSVGERSPHKRQVEGSNPNAQAMAAHESPRTTKLYDRTGDEITLDEVERITI